MRGLIIFAILLSAVALGERLPSDDTTINSTPEITATSPAAPTAAPSSSTTLSTPNEESSSLKPSSQATTSPSQEIALEENVSELAIAAPTPTAQSPISEDAQKRRIITYDQRQEGQYNIRADLENFMIVLIPPSPAEGLNLLDLLTKSAYRHNSNQQQHLGKNKRKHNSNFQQTEAAQNYRQSLKSGHGQQFNYVARSPSSHNTQTAHTATAAKQMPIAIIEGVSSAVNAGLQRLPEYIEGRTPYHVDISASDDEQSRLHPDRQVDVLPPPYPLAYQHLIKPFHLEAEPTVIQALPPPELHAAHVPSNFLESYNQLLTSGLQTAAAAESNSRARHNNDGPEIGYYRISRKIRSDNSIDSNNLSGTQQQQQQSPFNFQQYSLGRYPPIDIPEAFITFKAQQQQQQHRSMEQQQKDTIDNEQILDDVVNLPRIIVPPLNSLPQDDIEQNLYDVRLLDMEAKTLLSDGMERCAPGHRRDSYGMCREIEGY